MRVDIRTNIYMYKCPRKVARNADLYSDAVCDKILFLAWQG